MRTITIEQIDNVVLPSFFGRIDGTVDFEEDQLTNLEIQDSLGNLVELESLADEDWVILHNHCMTFPRVTVTLVQRVSRTGGLAEYIGEGTHVTVVLGGHDLILIDALDEEGEVVELTEDELEFARSLAQSGLDETGV